MMLTWRSNDVACATQTMLCLTAQMKKSNSNELDFLEAPPGFEPGNRGVADLCLTTWLWRHTIFYEKVVFLLKSNIRVRMLLCWSGLRGSNPPPQPWQGCALPNELNPHIWCLRSESNQRHGDFQSPALPTELQRHTARALYL